MEIEVESGNDYGESGGVGERATRREDGIDIENEGDSVGHNAGDVGNEAPNVAVPASQYTSYPTREGGRQGGSPVWKYVKLITGSHEECSKADKNKSKRTHVCIFEQKEDKCYALLRSQRHSYGGFNTTEPRRHFYIYHLVSAIGKEQSSKESKKRLGVIDSLSAASSVAPGLSAKKEALVGDNAQVRSKLYEPWFHEYRSC